MSQFSDDKIHDKINDIVDDIVDDNNFEDIVDDNNFEDVVDDIEYLKQLFSEIEDVNSIPQHESLDIILDFMKEVESVVEPSIFIQSISIPLPIFNHIFTVIKNLCMNKKSFHHFNFLGEAFTDNILNIMSVENHESHLFINPKNSTKGLYKNTFFDIVVGDTNEHTDNHINYILTNKFNFQSYFNTISKKKRFSYTDKKKSINVNNKFVITNTSKSDNYIQIENIRETNAPYIISKCITNFVIYLNKDKCTSGGRPGIPGSIYFIFKDRTSLIMFKKGTCLIVGSKPSKYRDTKEFMDKCLTNINYLVEIFYNFMKSKHHTKINNYLKAKCNCTHDNCEECDCLIRQRTNNYINQKPDMIREENNAIVYILKYKMYMNAFESDINVYKNIIANSNYNQSLELLTDQINNNKNGILASIYVPVFGLRKKVKVYAGVFKQIPLEHQNKINFFNGNSITYRSLKSTTEARLFLKAYDIVIKQIIIGKQEFNSNLFEKTEDEISKIVDDYFNICKF